MRAVSSTTSHVPSAWLLLCKLLFSLLLYHWWLRSGMWTVAVPRALNLGGPKGWCHSSLAGLWRPGSPERLTQSQAGWKHLLRTQLDQSTASIAEGTKAQPPSLKDGHRKGSLSQPESGTMSHDTDHMSWWKRNSLQVLRCGLFPTTQMLTRRGVGPGYKALISFKRGRHHLY